MATGPKRCMPRGHFVASLNRRGEVIAGVGVQPPCTGSTSQTSTANGAYLTSTGHSFEGVFRALFSKRKTPRLWPGTSLPEYTSARRWRENEAALGSGHARYAARAQFADVGLLLGGRPLWKGVRQELRCQEPSELRCPHAERAKNTEKSSRGMAHIVHLSEQERWS